MFPSFWISSAFKGAFGETLIVPDVSRHLENNLNWLDVGRTESSKFRQGLRGIAITGWQRYDHFSNLCELLPAAIPSLAVNLLTTSRGDSILLLHVSIVDLNSVIFIFCRILQSIIGAITL